MIDPQAPPARHTPDEPTAAHPADPPTPDATGQPIDPQAPPARHTPDEPTGTHPADPPTPDATGQPTDPERPRLDLERVAADLDGVERALGRLDDGTYWTDEVTGVPIPDEVLAADPVARRATEIG